MRNPALDPDRSLRRHLLAGLTTLLVLGGGMGGWAATAEIASAVVAPGAVVVDSYVKKVQHPTGGVVGEIRVRDGDRVTAGDVVVRLDETVTRANLAVITKGLDELAARRGRLEAERDGLAAIKVRPELAARAAEPEIAELIQGEGRLFGLRREARAGLQGQLRQRVEQLREQIGGQELQANAKGEEIRLIQEELKGVEGLYAKNLVPLTRVTALKREETRLKGEQGQLIAGVAQAKGKISETELQILQVDQDLRSEVARELRDIQGKSAELAEKRIAAEDQLRRIDIRAPQDGVVHQLAVHTVGGVISPADALMLIVPQADEMAIEVKVAPQDIDQLRIGQDAMLRLSAFNQRTTPEIRGRVSRVAADLIQDQKTGVSYYTARVATSPEELARLKGLTLVPGMPVEAFIQTGERTALSYLAKPLSDQMSRAFKGD
ncbi:HlyD family type I secretion periplasmic adaptor subunit [Salinarimonas soli]|uniref:Membrane fusion protein (MFP) family protein n=1 Tax=Salinarimonas soli TaxID=1638099 RepID=A0A5B2V7S6_9HYPH|nr:HlyD family type I secretion periplasmic adaptor subunit [Salinarimonas soli]KAA2234876.1 HlyD family type I secretion periplasmic adaptor subunit [Salinarimonas soli]